MVRPSFMRGVRDALVAEGVVDKAGADHDLVSVGLLPLKKTRGSREKMTKLAKEDVDDDGCRWVFSNANSLQVVSFAIYLVDESLSLSETKTYVKLDVKSTFAIANTKEEVHA